MGPPLPKESKERMHLIFNMITEYSEQFKNSITGKYDSMRSQQVTELSGGAMIKMMFNDLFEDFVQKGYKATKDYNDKDIDRAI